VLRRAKRKEMRDRSDYNQVSILWITSLAPESFRKIDPHHW
jgi:hypothetical protein